MTTYFREDDLQLSDEDEIVDVLYSLVHLKDIEGKNIPSYCFAKEIQDVYGLTDEEVIKLAINNGYRVFKINSDDLNIEDDLVISDSKITAEKLKDTFSTFFESDIEIKEINNKNTQIKDESRQLVEKPDMFDLETDNEIDARFEKEKNQEKERVAKIRDTKIDRDIIDFYLHRNSFLDDIVRYDNIEDRKKYIINYIMRDLPKHRNSHTHSGEDSMWYPEPFEDGTTSSFGKYNGKEVNKDMVSLFADYMCDYWRGNDDWEVGLKFTPEIIKSVNTPRGKFELRKVNNSQTRAYKIYLNNNFYMNTLSNEEKSIELFNEIINNNSLNESKEDTQRFITWAGKDLSDKFFKIKDRLKGQEKDIYYWMKKDKSELENKINSLLQVNTRKQKDIEAKGGADLIYSDNTWNVYHIKTFKASKKYGAHTKWCITGEESGWIEDEEENKYWKQYIEHGVKFYFYINKKDNKKYALALYPNNGKYKLFDEEDNSIIGIKNAPNVKGLPDIDLKEFVITDGELLVYNGNSENIVIPEDVKVIGNNTFAELANLKSITLPDNLQKIGDYAFSNCSSLKSITIPNSVTIIGESAFSGCSNLTSIDIPDSVISLGEFAFYNCFNLVSVSISNNLKSINKNTFLGCSNLESISIPNSVTAIGKNAFSNCSSLKSITLPDSITNLGYEVFMECTNLVSASVSKHMTTIPGGTFRYCKNLTSITIPDSITLIDKNAFEECEKLNTIKYLGTEEDWKRIIIGKNNQSIDNASIIYEPQLDSNKIIEDESLVETIEKHDELNPRLWDNEKKELLPEVKDKILDIVGKFEDTLTEDALDFVIDDVVIIGSNANYNYNEASDLDIHIIASSKPDCNKKHLDKIYNAYKSMFNSKYEITINDVPVEIYVELDEPKARSGGIYSLENGWIKEPKQIEIPEIDEKEFEEQFSKWEDRYFDLVEKEDTTSDDYDKLINDLYELRQDSIKDEGEFGMGNLVFKEMRNLGYLSDLKEKKAELESKELSLEDVSKDNIITDEQQLQEKENDSQSQRIKKLIDFLGLGDYLIISTEHSTIPESNSIKDNFITKYKVPNIVVNGYWKGSKEPTSYLLKLPSGITKKVIVDLMNKYKQESVVLFKLMPDNNLFAILLNYDNTQLVATDLYVDNLAKTQDGYSELIKKLSSQKEKLLISFKFH